MSGNDRKERSVTIRLSEEMISRFEQMQERNRASGKKASLSQVVREQLEGQGKSDRADSRIVLAEQRKNAAKTLQGLKNRILNGVLLTRTEWEFLCSMAHDAYRYRNGLLLEGQLLSDAMDAFRAFYEFRRREKGEGS